MSRVDQQALSDHRSRADESRWAELHEHLAGGAPRELVDRVDRTLGARGFRRERMTLAVELLAWQREWRGLRRPVRRLDLDQPRTHDGPDLLAELAGIGEGPFRPDLRARRVLLRKSSYARSRPADDIFVRGSGPWIQ